MNVQCRTCGAALTLEVQHRTVVCPYCASPSVLERPPTPDAPNPTFALGFSLAEAVAKQRVGAWLKRRSPFCRSGVRSASLEQVRGIYLPAYLYSAVSRSRYSAEIGEQYTTTETYTTTSNGRTVVRTRTVVKTEWRPLAGEHAAYVPDVLVTASRGLPNAELEAVEPFDLRPLRRYTPALVSGWIAEEPSITREECLAQARKEAVAQVGARLAAFMPGDSHQGLRWATDLDRESLELVLVPVWVLAARYDPKLPAMRVVVNGQSGEIHGRAPLSWVKITLAVLAVLAALAAIALLASRQGWLR